MNRFFELLKQELQKPLPGIEVQLQMASSDRMIRNFPRSPGNDARIAAVLILLYPYNDSIYTVFMQRHNYEGVHGGQISFPGGKKEPADKDIIETALREANEETGVDPDSISVIGNLTPLFIPVSNMLVAPVVGWTGQKPIYTEQPEEVVFLFDADINKLLDPAIVKSMSMLIRGESIDVKYFDYDGHVIWGATAMILHELLTIIREGNIPLR